MVDTPPTPAQIEQALRHLYLQENIAELPREVQESLYENREDIEQIQEAYVIEYNNQEGVMREIAAIVAAATESPENLYVHLHRNYPEIIGPLLHTPSTELSNSTRFSPFDVSQSPVLFGSQPQ